MFVINQKFDSFAIFTIEILTRKKAEKKFT